MIINEDALPQWTPWRRLAVTHDQVGQQKVTSSEKLLVACLSESATVVIAHGNNRHAKAVSLARLPRRVPKSLATKAPTNVVSTLAQEVATKSPISTVNTLATEVATKSPISTVNTLAAEVATKSPISTVNTLAATVATKASGSGLVAAEANITAQAGMIAGLTTSLNANRQQLLQQNPDRCSIERRK